MSDKYYEGLLTELSKHIVTEIKKLNKKHNILPGFVGLAVRDPTVDHVDIMYNCDKKSLIHILKVTLDQLEKNNGECQSKNNRD